MNRPLPNPLALAATRIPACAAAAENLPVTARGSGKLGEEDWAIRHRANLPEGEPCPDAMIDSLFEKFRERLRKRKILNHSKGSFHAFTIYTAG